MKRLGVTGHRPEKIDGYSDASARLVRQFAVKQLHDLKPKEVITGMALGWDTAIAEACCQLGIPFIAAVPFAGQERSWEPKHQTRYHDLLLAAKKVHIVSRGGYEAWKMDKRNRWIVNESTTMLALWDGSRGGTHNCVRYAQAQKMNVIDCWEEWLQFKRLSR